MIPCPQLTSAPRARAFACVIALVVLILGSATLAIADEPDVADDGGKDVKYWQFYGQAGAYIHYSGDSDFEGPPIGAGFEAHTPSRWFGGIFFLNNSYGDFSQYYYIGKQWFPFENHPHVNVKLSGGLLYGYSDEDIDDLPVHFGNVAPILLPTLGYKKGRVGYDIGLLGWDGLIFLVGMDLN